MARVPKADNFQVLPGVRQGQARAVLSPEQAAAPGRRMMAQGQQMMQVGGAVADYALQQQAKINKTRFNDAYNQALTEANRLKNEYGTLEGAEAVKGINGRPFTEHYRDEMRKSFSAIGAELHSPAVQEMFREATADLEGRFLRDAETYYVQQGEVYNERVRDALVVTLFNNIAADPENAEQVQIDLDRAKDTLRDKFMDAGYDGENLDLQMAQALGKAHLTVIESMFAEDNLLGARQYFERNRGDFAELDARNAQEGFQRKEAELRRKNYESLALGITQERVSPEDLSRAYDNGELDDGEYNTLLVQSANQAARKEAERKAQANEWRDQNYAILQVGIDDGNMSRADADLALKKGMISYSQWSSLSRQGTEKTAAARSMDEFLNNVTLGVPIDPSSADMKRGANEYFKKTGAADLLKGNGEQFAQGMQATTIMAVDAGIVPEAAVTTLRGLKASGTEDQQMFAIKAIGDLYSAQPNAVDAAFTGHEVAEAISYQFKINAGVPPSAAYKAILQEREARNEPEGSTSVTKARVAEARALSKDFDTPRAIKTTDRGGFLGLFKQNDISGGSLAEQQIVIDYQQAFQSYYVTHGDAELAQKQADAVIQRTVGVSPTNGGKVMSHPPERYYPDTGKEWMRNSLITGVAEAMNMEIEARDIELISDVQTARDVRDGRLPTYAVKVRTGDAEQIMPLRWSFDAEAAEEVARQQEAAKRKAKQSAARQTAAATAETTADALEGTFIPTSMMTPEQIERVKKTQKDARDQANTLRQRAEAK